MSSRFRKDIATIFDVCCIVSSDAFNSVQIKVLYPQEFCDEGILKSIKQFCIPHNALNTSVENEPVQLFTFAFTDASSLHTFGYCRFTPRNNSVLCILSGFSWTSFFYKFLNHISSVTTKGTPVDVESLLINAYHMDIPSPGSTFSLTACSSIGRFSDVVPNPSNLPTLQEDKSLLEFFNAVNERQMVQLYSSLLKERRIVFISSKLSQLSSCVFGLSKLLNPFEWQNLFIPILPQDLTDMLMAPMPYLIGVPKQIFLKINKNELGDIVLTDLDEKMLSSPYQDKLPQEAYNFLWNRLKMSNDLFQADSFAKTFLQANAILFGNYNSGFTQDSEGIYTWNREIFLERERPSIRPYLETLIGKDGVQYFERFVQERLEALKNGIAVNDRFEKEVQSLDVRGLSKGIWSKPPELLQQTVSSIKENASDVIVALKDQFQSMKMKDKTTISTKAPKTSNNHRRAISLKRKTKIGRKEIINPLSIDALEFGLDKEIVQKNEKNDQEKPLDVVSVHSVDDLINLNDDNEEEVKKEEMPLQTTTLSNNLHSSPNLFIQGLSTNNSFSTNSQSLIIPNGNTCSLQSEQFKRKNNWETFD